MHRTPLSGTQRRTRTGWPSGRPRALEYRLARNRAAWCGAILHGTTCDRLTGSRAHRRRCLVNRTRSSLGHNHARPRRGRALRRNWRSLCGSLRRGRLSCADLHGRRNGRCLSRRRHRRRLYCHRRRSRRCARSGSNWHRSHGRSNHARRCNARRWRRSRSRRFRNGHRGNRLRRGGHLPRGRRNRWS
jgi:hypothetical protein